jgi:hypothetical protein
MKRLSQCSGKEVFQRIPKNYNALHSIKYNADIPPKCEIRELKLKELKSKLATQQQFMEKLKSLSNNSTILSFKVAI